MNKPAVVRPFVGNLLRRIGEAVLDAAGADAANRSDDRETIFAALARRAVLRRLASRLGEPQFLFPLIAVALVAVLWVGTLQLVRVEEEASNRALVSIAGELAETYEAQVVRALREIDQSLRFIQYSQQLTGRRDLADLRSRGLLLPDLLFTVSIANAKGEVIAATRPGTVVIEGRDFFEAQRGGDMFFIGVPERNRQGEWLLHFSRRLATAEGLFDGVAWITVPVQYFVSGYESSKLGSQGLLAILGKDGVFRARRTGDSVTAGQATAYSEVTRGAPAAVLGTNTWDGLSRYASARELFEFPVAIVVGFGVEEQLLPVKARTDDYLARATFTSVLLVLVFAVLGRMSSYLARTRLLAHQAHYDTLTGLANRMLLQDRIETSIATARRNNTSLAAVFIDLDHFKLVNDTFGHKAGDELLQAIATRLRETVRSSDTVARMGGDEFVLLLPGLAPPGPEADQMLTVLIEKLVRNIAQPVSLGDRPFNPTCSVGVATFPRDGADAESLLRSADAAMYRAKDLGRNRYQFFTADVHERLRSRMELESELRTAIQEQQFELHYQPQVCLASREIRGTEALLRWRHPTKGLISPARFIEFAEETGLIVPIGDWVLREACRQNRAWQDAGLPAVRMSVNVSARQWEQRDIHATVLRALDLSGLDPRYLELELTESASMANPDQSVPLMEKLKGSGVALAIDDFGTGFSNLSYLRRFPVERLKIDISFVRDIASDRGSLAIAEAIINMSHSIGLKVVAEGVETPAQMQILAARRCDLIQGFLVSAPVPAEEYARLLSARLWLAVPSAFEPA